MQDDSFLNQFKGISSADFTMTPVTGATYSSNGMKHAVTLAMDTYTANKEAILSHE